MCLPGLARFCESHSFESSIRISHSRRRIESIGLRRFLSPPQAEVGGVFRIGDSDIAVRWIIGGAIGINFSSQCAWEQHSAAFPRSISPENISEYVLHECSDRLVMSDARSTRSLITWEFLRLCRGGSRSVTYTAVVLRETCEGLRHDVMPAGQQGRA